MSLGSEGSGPGSELRRSVVAATEKVEAIIDAAEETARQIRADAQASADAYLARRTEEVDAELEARSRESETAVRSLLERVEALRSQSHQFASELDVTAERLRQVAPTQPAAPASPAATGSWTKSFDAETAAPEPIAPAPAAAPEPEPVEEQAPVAPAPSAFASSSSGVGPSPVAYPGTEGSLSSPVSEDPVTEDAVHDSSSEEALLRATQLAVSGSSRADIEAALRSEFQLADVDSVLDGILGPEDR